MGNQGKMAGNSKICIGIQSQLILPEFIYLMLFLWKEYITSSNKQYSKSGVQRYPWSVFRKPQFFHTFSVILMLSNYRKCMGKSRFSKNWSQTSLHSRFIVLFLWTGNVSVKSKLQHAPPPRHTPGIWHLCRPGEEGIWLSESSRG